MIALGENIKRLRLSRGMTQPDLAKVVGATSYSTVAKWESGANSPKGRDLVILSNFFKVSVDALLGIEDNKVIQFPVSSNYPISPPISAGLPIEIDGVMENDVETISIPDYLMGKWAGNSDIYITRTNGDSMNRIIPHDTIIAIKPVELHELKDDDIVVYRKHGEYAVKRFERHPDKIVFRPDSTDRSFTDDVVYLDNADDLIIKGRVVLYIAELD